MEIRGSRGGYVEPTPLFIDLPDAPSRQLYGSCAMAARRFAGATEPGEPVVQLEMAQLHRFVEELRTLERDRRGGATLACPQLRLSFHIYDRAGHVRLAAGPTDYQMDGDHHVALSFELGPTALPGILGDFEDLLAFPCRAGSSAEGSAPRWRR
jgi:hypothetical protein